MIRLNFIVEGQTEEAFSNRVLVPHLSGMEVFPTIQLIRKKNSNSRKFKGGWLKYQSVKSHIVKWSKEDSSSNVWFTTMLDLYAIPEDFPGILDAKSIKNPIEKVKFLEKKFYDDIYKEGVSRFIPYLQLHEFEALLFSDPRQMEWEFLEHENQILNLINLSGKFSSPEEINSDPKTAPSKRIISEIPQYEGRKASAAPIIAEKIGLKEIRSRCLHFDSWLCSLEVLKSLCSDKSNASDTPSDS